MSLISPTNDPESTRSIDSDELQLVITLLTSPLLGICAGNRVTRLQ